MSTCKSQCANNVGEANDFVFGIIFKKVKVSIIVYNGGLN